MDCDGREREPIGGVNEPVVQWVAMAGRWWRNQSIVENVGRHLKKKNAASGTLPVLRTELG